MNLYEMLDVTMFTQKVWIYETNAYGQNMPVFKGRVHCARKDVDNVWNVLMNKVEIYECISDILLIKVKSNHYEDRYEKQYFNSSKWGTEENKRPWKYCIEIEREIKRERMLNAK